MSQLSNKVRVFACGAVLSTLAGMSLSTSALKADTAVEPLVATDAAAQIVASQSDIVAIERSVEADVQGASITAPIKGGLSLEFIFSWLSTLFGEIGI